MFTNFKARARPGLARVPKASSDRRPGGGAPWVILALLAWSCGGQAEDNGKAPEEGSPLRTVEEVCERTVGADPVADPHPDCTGQQCGVTCESSYEGATFVCDGRSRCVAVAVEGHTSTADAFCRGESSLLAAPKPSPDCTDGRGGGALCKLEGTTRTAVCDRERVCRALPL